LNEGVWNGDTSRKAYVDAVSDIEVEYAELSLSQKLGDPLTRKAQSITTRLAPWLVPLHDLSDIMDGMRTAYVVSFGETWEQLDREGARGEHPADPSGKRSH
jgi:hypothetical protein